MDERKEKEARESNEAKIVHSPRLLLLIHAFLDAHRCHCRRRQGTDCSAAIATRRLQIISSSSGRKREGDQKPQEDNTGNR